MTIGCGGGGKSELHWTLSGHFWHCCTIFFTWPLPPLSAVWWMLCLLKFSHQFKSNSLMRKTITHISCPPPLYHSTEQCWNAPATKSLQFDVLLIEPKTHRKERESDKINKRQRCGEVKRKKRKTIINYFLWTTNKQTEKRKRKIRRRRSEHQKSKHQFGNISWS